MSTYAHFAEGFLLPFLAAVSAGAILALFFGGLKWSYKKHLVVTLPLMLASFILSWLAVEKRAPERRMIVAGTIVDQSNNNPIGQAEVSLSDGSVRYTSEDNGNFILDLTGKVRESEKVRVRVMKAGYLPFDKTVGVPTEGFVIPLQHL